MASGLATRCPACDTAFRVVPDQLRVSDGWVRCGRCAEVFNAGERLIDVETGAPRQMPEPVAAPDAPPEPRPPAPPGASQVTATTHVDIEFDTAAPEPEAAPAADDGESAPRVRRDEGEALFETPSAADATAVAGTISITPTGDLDSELRAEPAAMPSFLRRAERAQRWRRPGVRATLAVLLALGLAGLLGQATYVYRDLVAARFAAARPVLDQACALLGCTIAPPRLIESLAVESSGLVRIEKSDVYKLSVVLRNRAGIAAALPAFDLALTDSQGKLLARRVLRAPEFGASQADLGPGRELSLQATLRAATDPVAGYTIELFYP